MYVQIWHNQHKPKEKREEMIDRIMCFPWLFKKPLKHIIVWATLLEQPGNNSKYQKKLFTSILMFCLLSCICCTSLNSQVFVLVGLKVHSRAFILSNGLLNYWKIHPYSHKLCYVKIMILLLVCLKKVCCHLSKDSSRSPLFGVDARVVCFIGLLISIKYSSLYCT